VDLDGAVRTGKFREDLYYRLNVVDIVVPPLRERAEDILPLAERLLTFFGRQNHRGTLRFTWETIEALQGHDWPGNVRELRNAVERAVLLCRNEEIGVEFLPFTSLPSRVTPRVGDLIPMERVEEEHIRRVLAATRSIEEACQVLGMDSVTLWRRRKKYGI
jgi:two-component system, NtrC family, response regulator AlgB